MILRDIVRHLLDHYKDRSCVVVYCPIRELFFVGQQGTPLGPFGLSWDGRRLHPAISAGLGDRHSSEFPEAPSCSSDVW